MKEEQAKVCMCSYGDGINVLFITGVSGANVALKLRISTQYLYLSPSPPSLSPSSSPSPSMPSS